MYYLKENKIAFWLIILKFGPKGPVIDNTSALVLVKAHLTHWGRDNMAAIFQTTYSNAFFLMKKY